MAQRPNLLRFLYLAFINIYGPPRMFGRIFMQALGKLHPDEKDYVPESEYNKVYWESRIYLLIIFSVIALCFILSDIRPILYVVTPFFYGGWLIVLYGTPQHVGLHEDVLDHRLNTRTIYLDPFLSFLYLNMNYHIEHHMFPLVPYYNLKALHEEMKHDCPAPNRNVWSAFKETYYAFKMQTQNSSHVIERPLPPTANPYYYGPAPYLKQVSAVTEQAG